MSDNGIQLRCIVHAYDQEELTWSVTSDPATLTVLDDAPGTGFAADWFIEFSGTGTTHGYFVSQYGSLTPANTVVILITTDSAFVSMEDSAWPDTTGTFRYVRMFGAEYRLDPVAGNQWFIEDEALAALVIAASDTTIPVFIWDVDEIPGEGNPPEWQEIDDVTIFQSEAATYSRNMNDYVVSETNIIAWTTTNGNITQPPAGGIWTPGTTTPGVITSYQTATNGGGYTDEAQEVIDRMQATDKDQNDAIAAFVDSQVASGNWALMDEFVCPALNETDAMTGWIQLTMTPVGPDMEWTPNGWLHGGTDSWVDSNINPTTFGGNYTIENASISIFMQAWSYAGTGGSRITGADGILGSDLRLTIGGAEAENSSMRMNSGSWDETLIAPDGVGHHTILISDDNTGYYRDGVLQGPGREGDGGMPDDNIFIAAGNDGGVGTNNRECTWSAWHIGGDLVNYQNYYDNLISLLDSLGVDLPAGNIPAQTTYPTIVIQDDGGTSQGEEWDLNIIPDIIDEVHDVLDRMDNPSTRDINAITNFVTSQVESGNWPEFDEFWCWALEERNSLIGWIERTAVAENCYHVQGGYSFPNTETAYLDTGMILNDLTHWQPQAGMIGFSMAAYIYDQTAPVNFFGVQGGSANPMRASHNNGTDTVTGRYNSFQDNINTGIDKTEFDGTVFVAEVDGTTQRSWLNATALPVEGGNVQETAQDEFPFWFAGTNSSGSQSGSSKSMIATIGFVGSNNLDLPNLSAAITQLYEDLGVYDPITSYAEWDWREHPTQPSPSETTNYNQPSRVTNPFNFSVADRQEDHDVFKYSITGETPYDDETWYIEANINDEKHSPRNEDGQSLRHYTDFGSPFIATSDVDRSEYFILRPFVARGAGGGIRDDNPSIPDTGLREGETMWFGWSEKYISLDNETVGNTTILQINTQPYASTLDEWDINEPPYNDGVLISGGPGAGITMGLFEGQHYRTFAVRRGTMNAWDADNQTDPEPVELNKWEDFIMRYTWSPTDQGTIEVWKFDPAVDNPDEYWPDPDKRIWFYEDRNTDYESYSAEYAGPGPSYEPPSESGLESCAIPELRWGLYRHSVKDGTIPVPQAGRFMEKIVGPFRWLTQEPGEYDISGFDDVKPRGQLP